MSPVKESNNRSAVLAVGGLLVAVLGLGLLLLFVFAVQSGTESDKVQVKLGSDTFAAGPSQKRAATIAEGGPILFSDVASGERDIYLQHVGDDTSIGWSAFDARRLDKSRDCTLHWSSERGLFEDPCDGATVDATGTGLRHYKVEVNNDGDVVIDLRESTTG